MGDLIARAERVFEYLKEVGEASARQVCDALGIDKFTSLYALRYLCCQGRVDFYYSLKSKNRDEIWYVMEECEVKQKNDEKISVPPVEVEPVSSDACFDGFISFHKGGSVSFSSRFILNDGVTGKRYVSLLSLKDKKFCYVSFSFSDILGNGFFEIKRNQQAYSFIYASSFFRRCDIDCSRYSGRHSVFIGGDEKFGRFYYIKLPIMKES